MQNTMVVYGRWEKNPLIKVQVKKGIRRKWHRKTGPLKCLVLRHKIQKKQFAVKKGGGLITEMYNMYRCLQKICIQFLSKTKLAMWRNKISSSLFYSVCLSVLSLLSKYPRTLDKFSTFSGYESLKSVHIHPLTSQGYTICFSPKGNKERKKRQDCEKKI